MMMTTTMAMAMPVRANDEGRAGVFPANPRRVAGIRAEGVEIYLARISRRARARDCLRARRGLRRAGDVNGIFVLTLPTRSFVRQAVYSER